MYLLVHTTETVRPLATEPLRLNWGVMLATGFSLAVWAIFFAAVGVL